MPGLDKLILGFSRLPITESEAQTVIAFTKDNQRRGWNTRFDETMARGADEFLREGIVVLACPDIRMIFAFVKLNAGTGFFGGQKAKYASFFGEFLTYEFEPGPIFGSMIRAVVSINNIYRAMPQTVGHSRHF